MSARVRIALFVACVNATMFPEVGIGSVRLLERLGHRFDAGSAG